MKLRTYTELLRLSTFEARFAYLKLHSVVGRATFGYDRWINQRFYTSGEWKKVRNDIILRDNGCDLGIEDRQIFDRIIIHHMNPMTPDDIKQGRQEILDPEFLVSTTLNTHNAIHFGDESLLPRQFVERRPGDTKLWR